MASLLAASHAGVRPTSGRTATLQRSTFRSGTAVQARRLTRKPSRTQAVRTQARAAAKQAYICIDCGYIYDGADPFEKLPNSYRCPVCSAPKRRFKAYDGPRGKNDSKSMNSRWQSMQKKGSSVSAADAGVTKDDGNFFLLAAAGGAILLAALYFGINSQLAL